MKNSKILEIYSYMHLIRAYDEKIVKEYKHQEIRCPVHLSIGQEGIAAGIMSALNKKDIVMSNHRAHGHYIAKGCSIEKMTSEIYGKVAGCSGGKGGSMHLIDIEKNFYGSTPIVASTIPILTGIAFANKQKKKDILSVIFFGDGAYESGNFHECLNFATTHKLKMLFICENNFFSVYSPLKCRQPENHKIYKVAETHGIFTHFIDGNKADSIYKVVKDLRSKILKYSKPGFLELTTYRFYEHCGTNYDDHLGYRDPKATKIWKKKDPLIYFESKYKKFKNEFEKIQLLNEKQINKIFDQVKKEKYPNKKNLAENLYA